MNTWPPDAVRYTTEKHDGTVERDKSSLAFRHVNRKNGTKVTVKKRGTEKNAMRY